MFRRDHIEALDTINNLGNLYFDKGKFDEAKIPVNILGFPLSDLILSL